jgi:hypothetical protein
MTDPIDLELNHMCGEVWDHISAEQDYAQEDPLGSTKAVGTFLLFLCFGAMCFLGALIVRRLQ